ncbi:MAG TPA: hypothetical protein VES20_22115 [Bryobacteraceae bacterium]|nr:hypothetical protein [Bryobacteraceae bacterium]
MRKRLVADERAVLRDADGERAPPRPPDIGDGGFDFAAGFGCVSAEMSVVPRGLVGGRGGDQRFGSVCRVGACRYRVVVDGRCRDCALASRFRVGLCAGRSSIAGDLGCAPCSPTHGMGSYDNMAAKTGKLPKKDKNRLPRKEKKAQQKRAKQV